jgi:UDP-N-acetylmuramoylalanine--D-glutamate ligase
MKGIFKKWEKLLQGPVAILGAGISGNGASALLTKFGWDHEIYDEQGRAFTNEEARACSFVVCSPGFKKDHPWRLIAKTCGKEIVSETDFAASFTESKIISITGTNGKTTLATFLAHLWNVNGTSAIAAGNVGLPLSQVIADGLGKETTVFLETSSFQSEDLKYLKPDTVIWTNFEDDHLDHHKTKRNYFNAKAKLLKLVDNGKVLIGKSVKDYADYIGYVIPMHTHIVDRLDNSGVLNDRTHFLESYPQSENMALALKYAALENVRIEVFKEAMKTYHPEPHRLQKIETIGNATFWNDSKATNLCSTFAACKNFTGNLFWIGGGRRKGGLLEEFAKKLKPLVNQVFLIGETGESLAKIFKNDGLSAILCDSLEQAVKNAFSKVTKKTDILFSPGFASFDSFTDYADRGKSFINHVLDLKKVTTMTTHNKSIDFVH